MRWSAIFGRIPLSAQCAGVNVRLAPSSFYRAAHFLPLARKCCTPPPVAENETSVGSGFAVSELSPPAIARDVYGV